MDVNPYEAPREAREPSRGGNEPVNWWRLAAILIVGAILIFLVYSASLPASA